MDWIKQKKEGEENNVLDDKSDVYLLKNETCNPEGIKQDPDNYFGLLDMKPVLFKQKLTAAGNGGF